MKLAKADDPAPNSGAACPNPCLGLSDPGCLILLGSCVCVAEHHCSPALTDPSRGCYLGRLKPAEYRV